jgi:hypothetical protein
MGRPRHMQLTVWPAQIHEVELTAGRSRSRQPRIAPVESNAVSHAIPGAPPYSLADGSLRRHHRIRSFLRMHPSAMAIPALIAIEMALI